MLKNKLLLISIGLVIGLTLAFASPAILIPITIVLAGLIMGIFLIYSIEHDRPKTLVKIFALALVLRIAICLLLALVSYSKQNHVFFLGCDDYGYSANAIKIVTSWRETGYIPEPKSLLWMMQAGQLNYYYFLSYLYYFIGEYTMMPLFINCTLGALTVIFVYFLAKELYNYKVAVSSAFFFAFWPSTFLWSTQNLRESITIFFIILIFLSIVKLQRKINKIIYWIILFISLFIIFKIRFSIFSLLLVSVVVSLFFFNKRRIIYGLSGLFIIFFALIRNWFGLGQALFYHFGLKSINVILIALNHSHQAKIRGADTPFLAEADISTPLNFISYMPKFILYILFAPFPWEASKFRHLFAFFEILIWLFLIIFAIKGLLLTLRYKFKDASILFIFLLIMLFSFFSEGNVGTLFRHRALIWPCWHIFISVGLFYYVKKGELPFSNIAE